MRFDETTSSNDPYTNRFMAVSLQQAMSFQSQWSLPYCGHALVFPITMVPSLIGVVHCSSESKGTFCDLSCFVHILRHKNNMRIQKYLFKACMHWFCHDVWMFALTRSLFKAGPERFSNALASHSHIIHQWNEHSNIEFILEKSGGSLVF